MPQCCEAYHDFAHFSRPFVPRNNFCHFLNSDLSCFPAFLIRLIDKGDLGARDRGLSIDGITRMDEDPRAACKFQVYS